MSRKALYEMEMQIGWIPLGEGYTVPVVRRRNFG